MKRPPLLADHHLVFAMERAWLTRGPLRNYTPVKLGSTRENDIYRADGKLYIKHVGVEQVVWFKDAPPQHDGRGPVFHLHNLGLTDIGYVPKCLTAIEERLRDLSDNQDEKVIGLPEKRGKTYDKIFGDVAISLDTLNFGGRDFTGLHVEAPVLEIPFGREGRLSDNLFVYAYNVLMLPCFKMALDKPQPTRDTWYEFVGGSSSI